MEVTYQIIVELTYQVTAELTHQVTVKLTYQVIVESLIVVFLVFILPHFSQSNGVLLHHVDTRAPLVRTSLAEYVAHVGAGDDLKHSSAHPHLQPGSPRTPVTFSASQFAMELMIYR